MAGEKNQYGSNAGYSLVEVLVSVFVLSIGILGAVGLQLSAFRSNQQSSLAVVATQISQDIAERIRANDAMSSLPDDQNPYLFDTGNGNAAKLTAKGCFATECTPSEMAAADVYEWVMRIVGEPLKPDASLKEGALQGLPGGRGVVCRDDAIWEADIGYRWACETSVNGANAPIVVKLGWYSRNVDGALRSDESNAYDDRPSLVMVVKP